MEGVKIKFAKSRMKWLGVTRFAPESLNKSMDSDALLSLVWDALHW